MLHVRVRAVDSPPIVAIREYSIAFCSMLLSVNNPTDKKIAATLTKNMELPGFDFPERNIALKPGDYQVLVDSI